jgi:hypothetical protein
VQTLTGQAQQVRAALIRFGYVFFIILVALPVVLVLAFMDPIYWWWFDEFRRPAIEREFGFQAEHREVAFPSGNRSRLLVITEVVPGGRFDRSGAKRGDVVVCLHHGDPDFWSRLLIAREGYESEIRLLAADELAHGCEGARRIRFEGRSITGRSGPQNIGLEQTALRLRPDMRHLEGESWLRKRLSRAAAQAGRSAVARKAHRRCHT